jgi:hypothetical protein
MVIDLFISYFKYAASMQQRKFYFFRILKKYVQNFREYLYIMLNFGDLSKWYNFFLLEFPLSS